jgi:hypothetical protein
MFELSNALEVPHIRVLIVAGGGQQVGVNGMPDDPLAPPVAFHAHRRH